MGLIFFAFFEKFFVPILTSGGYVGLSIATLLSQHHQVTAVDIIPEKVDMINNRNLGVERLLAWSCLKHGDIPFICTLCLLKTLLCLFRLVYCYRYCSENLEVDGHVC